MEILLFVKFCYLLQRNTIISLFTGHFYTQHIRAYTRILLSYAFTFNFSIIHSRRFLETWFFYFPMLCARTWIHNLFQTHVSIAHGIFLFLRAASFACVHEQLRTNVNDEDILKKKWKSESCEETSAKTMNLHDHRSWTKAALLGQPRRTPTFLTRPKVCAKTKAWVMNFWRSIYISF